MDDIYYWLALLRVPRIGPIHFQALLSQYGDPRQVFERAPHDESVRRALPEAALHGLTNPDWRTAEADLAWAGRAGAHLLPLNDPRYPALLKEIHDPPPVLFVLGDIEALGARQVAIVGSRNPSPVGSDTALQFAAELARSGLVITSGLAIGIDGAAHRGAVTAGGRTIAVMGNGLDIVYPPRHRELAQRIRERGALVSEFPPGSQPLPECFPRRNRLISGLSLGTLVVEAAPRSGSLITARAALEQGREVFAIPGSIHNPRARGCHLLLRQGAKLVECAQDILEEVSPAGVMTPAAAQARNGPSATLETTAARVLESIDFAPTAIDALVERTGIAAERLYSILLTLEMSDHISPVPGGYARRR